MYIKLRDFSIYTLLAVLGVLYLPVVSSTATSVPSAVPPSDRELETMYELAAWVQGSSGEALALELDSVSFELFTLGPEEDQVSDRVGELPFGIHIQHAAQKVNLDPVLLAAVAEVESSFNPSSVSVRGAQGLMQLMPATAQDLRVDNPLDPESNLMGGARYLAQLIRQFEGDIELALAAYNAGPGNVRRFGGIPPFRETRRYVEKVIGVYVGHYRELWSEGEDLPVLPPLSRSS